MSEVFAAVTFPEDQDDLAAQVLGRRRRGRNHSTHVVPKLYVTVPLGRANHYAQELRALGVNAHILTARPRARRRRAS